MHNGCFRSAFCAADLVAVSLGAAEADGQARTSAQPTPLSTDRPPMLRSTWFHHGLPIDYNDVVLVQQAVPNELLRLAEEWRAMGSPPQRGIPWSATRWRRSLPEYDHLYDWLPEPLDRSAVQRYVDEHAEADPAAAFVATMVWGFGNVGYGPFRTRRILESGPDVSVRLASAVGPTSVEEAYAALAGHRRVPWH